MNEKLQSELAMVMPGEKQGGEATAKARAAKGMNAAEKKEIRQEEDLNKKALLEREKENFTHIFALKCYDGWLRLHDNSAMIVSTWLDGRLGRGYNRNDDRGYGTKAQYGVVSVPPDGVTDFIQRLAKVKIPLRYDDAWVLEFELGTRISKEDMVRMLHEDELIIDKVNKLVMPKETLPGLRARVKTLLDFVHVQVMHQKESIKNVFLNDVERLAIEMNKTVIATARGRIAVEECLEQMGKYAEEMYMNATTMSDLRLITAKQYKSFVDCIKGVESERARELKRRALKQAEKKIEDSKKR